MTEHSGIFQNGSWHISRGSNSEPRLPMTGSPGVSLSCLSTLSLRQLLNYCSGSPVLVQVPAESTCFCSTVLWFSICLSVSNVRSSSWSYDLSSLMDLKSLFKFLLVWGMMERKVLSSNTPTRNQKSWLCLFLWFFHFLPWSQMSIAILAVNNVLASSRPSLHFLVYAVYRKTGWSSLVELQVQRSK